MTIWGIFQLVPNNQSIHQRLKQIQFCLSVMFTGNFVYSQCPPALVMEHALHTTFWPRQVDGANGRQGLN